MSEDQTPKGKYVFVVCGSSDHIDTLHFSICALRRFSDREIIVLTDSTRNEIPIVHDNIIDVRTPSEYNHHQSSIFLKTGVHKFLPGGHSYCYIDTDVVAISCDADQIFDQKNGIITFASDHCKVREFSPHAVKCSCADINNQERTELNMLLKKYDGQDEITDPVIIKKRDALIRKFKTIKIDRFGYLLISLRFMLTPVTFRLDEDTFYHRWEKYWYDRDGNILLYAKPRAGIHPIEKNTGWRWDRKVNKWYSPSGNNVDEVKCDHLTEYIAEKFDIQILQKDWQHWNGGVFLFDDNSYGFLESWHQKTLAIFQDPKWKTRDQGTLIATAWQFDLQDQQTLPIAFNFLADYHHPTMKYLGDFNFCFDDEEKKITPKFLHIYHEWGNKDWDLWMDVERMMSIN
jgi:hypothetical protein